jgi:hypothetical protein
LHEFVWEDCSCDVVTLPKCEDLGAFSEQLFCFADGQILVRVNFLEVQG